MDDAMLNDALEELIDALVAAQVLAERFRETGRPYLAMRAREFEGRCHDELDTISAAAMGYTPVEARA